jgi:tRNA threonylcarbamoyl adenosine modification protein YeaZ
VKVLAIEISSVTASLAVADDGHLIEIRRFEAPRGRGAEVFSLLDEMRPAWTGLGRLAIGIGPGSYNGLRVACALAGSFQMALGIEVVTSPSCCLLDVATADYLAAGDARGGRIWWAEVRSRRLSKEIALLTHEDFRQRAATAGLPLYRIGPIRDGESLPPAAPDAGILATLAGDWPPADPAHLEPLYLKPPHITVPNAARP